MEQNAKIIAVTGKGGVGKTSLSAVIVKLLTECFPEKRILAIDADPAVGLATALGIEVNGTVDDIRKEFINQVETGNANEAVEMLGNARYMIFDTLIEQQGFSFLAIGRPESAGCYCKLNSYLRAGANHILTQDYHWPVLTVDRPYVVGNSGQLRTRIQAFVERIEIKKLQGGDLIGKAN